MNKWLKYALYALLWVGVVAYIIFAGFAVRSHRTAQRVEGVEIQIVDSSAIANIVTRPMVEGWIAQSKIRTVGQRVDSVDLVALESCIMDGGFVEQVKCFTSYSGVLHVKISQLRPVLRILLDGYNSYVTADGYIFARPAASSRYTPVITGSYSPLFRAGFTGNIADLYRDQVEEIEAEIKRVEVKNIYPLYAQRIKLREQLREVNSRYTRRRFGQSRKAFDKEVADLKERNAQDRARLTRELSQVAALIFREEQKQKVYADKQKKLEKKYKDFINLLTFVNVVENDKFWSSEIVQMVATESTSNSLRLELIPRSGEHTITFGQIEGLEESGKIGGAKQRVVLADGSLSSEEVAVVKQGIKTKLDNTKTFYKRVLGSRGWLEFKNINVEYKGQVVCK